MSEYFPKVEHSGGRVKVELVASVDKSDFSKKTDLTNLTSNLDKLDINKFKNVSNNLSHLKSKVDKLDADKLVPVPVDLSMLNDLVKRSCEKRCI